LEKKNGLREFKKFTLKNTGSMKSSHGRRKKLPREKNSMKSPSKKLLQWGKIQRMPVVPNPNQKVTPV